MKLKKETTFLFFLIIFQICICQNRISSKDGFISPDIESFEGQKPGKLDLGFWRPKSKKLLLTCS